MVLQQPAVEHPAEHLLPRPSARRRRRRGDRRDDRRSSAWLQAGPSYDITIDPAHLSGLPF